MCRAAIFIYDFEVGWVERSETHRRYCNGVELVGFALLYPPYGLGCSRWSARLRMLGTDHLQVRGGGVGFDLFHGLAAGDDGGHGGVG